MKLYNGHEFFGTTDRVVERLNNRADVFDYKFGRLSIPEADDNLQGLAYAIGVFQAMPATDMVQVHFLQPRRRFHTKATYFRDHLHTYVSALTRLFDKITAPKPKRTACKACEYCALLPECKEAARRAVRAVKLKRFHPPKERLPEKMTPQTVDEYFLPLTRILDRYSKEIKDMAKRMLKDGAVMQHHELAERNAPRKKDSDPNQEPEKQTYLRRK